MKKMTAAQMSVISGGKRKKCRNCGKTYGNSFTYTYHGIWNFNSQCLVDSKIRPW